MAENEQDHQRYGPDPGQEAGATTEQTQAGEELADVPPPEDLRDTYGNAGPAVGDAVAAGEMGVALPEGGPYPMPTVVERPHTAQRSQTFSAEPNRDPSLSRAVDRAAVGLTPEDAGYDRSIEGPPPGPLDPEAHEESAEAENEPGGAWGSSG